MPRPPFPIRAPSRLPAISAVLLAGALGCNASSGGQGGGGGAGHACGTTDGVCPADCAFPTDGDCPEPADYYVSPSGDDANPGDIDHPFKSIEKAHSVAAPGMLIYFRGGTYHPRDPARNGILLEGIDGTADAKIRFWAYPGEQVVFDFSTFRDNQYPLRSIMFNGEHWHWKGFDLVATPQYPGRVMSAVFVAEAKHCIFEQLRIHDNHATGFILKDSSDDNLVLNCDAYNNQDPIDNYENANGFMSVTDAGTTNTFRGCRAWWNCDDGFDHFRGAGLVVHESCWAFWNGYKPGGFEAAGNGMGFKFGSSPLLENGDPRPPTSEVLRVATNCLAYRNLAFGFDQNALTDAIRLQNCTAYRNVEYGIRLPHHWPQTQQSPPYHIVQNCLAYDNVDGEGELHDALVNAGSTDDHNSWNGSVTVTDADFLSVDPAGIDGPRGFDGSLPALSFLKLAPGSDLIGKGVDVGLPYLGAAPDLGAFERE